MTITLQKKYLLPIQNFLQKTDWKLLVFLLLFLNVKILIKIAAIVFIYYMRPDSQFGFRFKTSRLPLFYLIIPAIGLLNYFIYAGFAKTHYSLVFITGIVFWLLSILAIHQVKLSVERSPVANIHRALFVFFVLNMLASAVNLLRIQWEIWEWNPYIYQGMYQKYFIGTGDYIKGISFDTSTTNAILNAFGIFYFLTRKHFLAAICCMAVLLLTCSNTVNIAVMGIFIYCFFFQSSRAQKSVIVICMAMLVLFLAKVSPQNNEYAIRTFQKTFHRVISKTSTSKPIPVEQRPDSVLSMDEKKYKVAKLYLDSLSIESRILQKDHPYAGRPSVPVANIHTAPYQHKQDSSETRLQILRFAMDLGRDTSVQKVNAAKVPGKILAIQETVQYLQQHPSRILTGTGIGNFSSKLAFRTTGLQVAGGYPSRYTYINDDFKKNHLAIFLDYFDKDSGFHSIINSPNSVYTQLLSEYGIAGLLALLFFYLWFFVRSVNRKGYAIPMVLILCCVFAADYWFEQLSVIVLFELLLFLDKKEKTYQLIV